jgi:AcrR family transcriptional regulator
MGYDAVTIQKITERADVGLGTFYVHFKNKEDIVWVIIRESFEEMERASRQFLAGLSLAQRDYLNFIGFFQYIGQKGSLLRAASMGQGSPILTRYVADYTAKRAEQRLNEDNPFSALDMPTDFAAQFMTGALMRSVAWWTSNPNDYTAEQMASMFYKLLYHKAPPQS